MARPTQTLLGAKAREAIHVGVNAIYNPVKLTLGPQARKALIYRTMNRGSRIVDDGFQVSEVQEPKNIFVRLASQAFKESCKRTNQRVGDGTTTTVVVGGTLFNYCYSLLTEGTSTFKKSLTNIGITTLKNKILESAKKVKEKIKESATPIKTLEDLEKVAIVSVEDTDLGKVIAKMAWDVGVDGFIDVVEGYKGEIETEMKLGMRFAAKVAHKAFVTNPSRYEMVAQDCQVVVTNHALDNASEIGGVFQRLNATTSKIIVIAPSFSDNVLVNMVNAAKGGYFIYPVSSPSLRTEQFEDVAIYCGARFVDKNKGASFRNVDAKDLGFVEKLIVKDTESKEEAVATGGRGETQQLELGKKDEIRFTTALQERIDILRGQLVETKQENFKKLMERRIASLASKGAVIRVGDSTEASSLYRKLKVEDAVYACKAALRGGYVKGGGLCLKEIAETLPDDDILKKALLAPYEQIQSSVDGGIDVSPDILDPMEVPYYAVEYATSVVANLITVEIITPETEDTPYGEGEFATARAISELTIALRRHFGQLKESEEESARDNMTRYISDSSLSTDELVEAQGMRF